MKFIFFIVAVLQVTLVQAQIAGRVFQTNSETNTTENLPGVNLFWLGTTVGTSTSNNGSFSIAEPGSYPAKLVFSFVGFKSDTITVFTKNQNLQVELKSSVELDAAEVIERKQSTSIDLMKVRGVEEMGSEELTRAACCNISEAFETNASVDVVATDGVTGSKKIQMLGLDGIYTSLQFENIPFIRGLANLDGLSHVPGTWVESVQISKGTGSVVNGYEAMTGQINLELIKPDKLKELVFVNLYGNTMGRGEINLHVGTKLNSKWSTALMVHANAMQQKNDNNNDGFLDMPLKNQINVFNRWKFKGKKYMAQFGFRAIGEELQGGQLDFNPDTDLGTTNRYGTKSQANHVEGFFKNGFIFHGHPGRSMAFIARGSYHSQDMTMGLRNYSGEEYYGYFNLIYQDIIKTTDHKYKLGGSYVYDNFRESLSGISFNREELVPGVFAEYTYTGKKTGAVLGVRNDFHNLYGNQFSPKANFKYNFSKRGVVRLSGGRGWRVPNWVVENASTLVSSRIITAYNNVQPEIAWNTGASVTQKLQLWERDLTLHGEYFYTWFENQLVANREIPGLLSFDNLNGQSFSHAVQLEAGYIPWKTLELKLAAKYLDVKSTYNGSLSSVPLVPNWRGMVSLGYKTLNKKWQADLTTQFVGISRVPSTLGNLPENIRETESDPYAMINTQVTRRFKWIDVYAGLENLFAYKQPNAIISADKPFSSEFDASLIWGPVNGRVIYAGLRMRFFKK
jgi:hypothetical protein